MLTSLPPQRSQDVSVDAATVKRKLDAHVIPWLFALGVLCYIDRTNLRSATASCCIALHLPGCGPVR